MVDTQKTRSLYYLAAGMTDKPTNETKITVPRVPIPSISTIRGESHNKLLLIEGCGGIICKKNKFGEYKLYARETTIIKSCGKVMCGVKLRPPAGYNVLITGGKFNVQTAIIPWNFRDEISVNIWSQTEVSIQAKEEVANFYLLPVISAEIKEYPISKLDES
jgi:hypothetical protein